MCNPSAAPVATRSLAGVIVPNAPARVPRPSPDWRSGAASLLGAAVLAACGTKPLPAPAPKPPDPPPATQPSKPRPAPPRGPAAAPPTPPLRTTPYPGRDGPDPNPPPNLMQVPDAVPRVERLRAGSPNLPYSIRGQSFQPLNSDQPVRETGIASWYGRKFHGQRTASGEIYNMYAMTAAHPTLPIPSYARVRNRSNGREVIVRVNDRGPFKYGRIIDLSYTAGLKLGFVKGAGTAPVELERITHEAIRTGSWRMTDLLADPPSSGPDDDAMPGAWLGALAGPWIDGGGAWGGPSVPGGLASPEPAWPAAPPDATRSAPADLPPGTAETEGARGWWLRIAEASGIDPVARLQQRLSREAQALAPLLAIRPDGRRHALEAGPFPTREEALAAAQRLPRPSGAHGATGLLQRR